MNLRYVKSEQHFYYHEVPSLVTSELSDVRRATKDF